MNIFRPDGDMTHLLSVLVLVLKMYATKSCSGLSVKTQELYAAVFLAWYLDLFTDFISVYNTVMKLVFIASSVSIVTPAWISGLVQAALYADFFYYYFISCKDNEKLKHPA